MQSCLTCVYGTECAANLAACEPWPNSTCYPCAHIPLAALETQYKTSWEQRMTSAASSEMAARVNSSTLYKITLLREPVDRFFSEVSFARDGCTVDKNLAEWLKGFPADVSDAICRADHDALARIQKNPVNNHQLRLLLGLNNDVIVEDKHLRMGLRMLHTFDIVLVQKQLVPQGLALFDFLLRGVDPSTAVLSPSKLLAAHMRQPHVFRKTRPDKARMRAEANSTLVDLVRAANVYDTVLYYEALQIFETSYARMLLSPPT